MVESSEGGGDEGDEGCLGGRREGEGCRITVREVRMALLDSLARAGLLESPSTWPSHERERLPVNAAGWPMGTEELSRLSWLSCLQSEQRVAALSYFGC